VRRSLLAFTIAVLAIAAPIGSGAASNHTFGEDSFPCGDDGTISWTPTTLWPPNHKMHDITVTYSDPDGGTSTLTVTATDHSDIVGGEEINGTGPDRGPDSVGAAGTGTDGDDAVAVAEARGERSGHSKDGREYSFTYVATNDGGTPEDPSDDDGCTGPDDDEGTEDEILVTVPHDCRNGACRP
jgi:hypothetical protein